MFSCGRVNNHVEGFNKVFSCGRVKNVFSCGRVNNHVEGLTMCFHVEGLTIMWKGLTKCFHVEGLTLHLKIMKNESVMLNFHDRYQTALS